MTTLNDFKEVFELCSKIQEETQHCVFIDYSGHVNKLDILVAMDKNNYNEIICSLGEPWQGKYIENVYKEEINSFLSKLQKVFDTANDKLLLAETMQKKNILSEYKKQVDLGVSKGRSIKNLAKQFQVTQKKVTNIINETK